MRHYRLTESRVIRVLRYPLRIEEGILDGAVACMQSAGGKRYSEIWAMYLIKSKSKDQKAKEKGKQLKIITAWRYPGKSPERDPVPAEILRDVKNLIFSSAF